MTSLNAFLSLLAGVLLLASYLPYGVDILKHKVKPARSARLMFVLLLLIVLLQQRSLGSGWVLAVTVSELVGSATIFGLAMKYGEGGWGKLDISCYFLLFISVTTWLVTNNALLALHMTIAADLIAFMPTLVKTWRKPRSETPLFFAVGASAPLLSLVALNDYRYSIVAFPLYLALINALEVGLIYKNSLLRFRKK